MIRIKTIYLSLALTVLMAVGCLVKGWSVGVVLWALFALVCVGRILRLRRDEKDRDGPEKK